MTVSTIFLVPDRLDGSVPDAEIGSLVTVEEFDIQLPSYEEEDLVFANQLELRCWLMTSNHPSAEEWRHYGWDPNKVGFIGVFSQWRGKYDFVDPRWAKYAKDNLL